MTSRLRAPTANDLRGVVKPVISLVAWIHLYLLALLGAWIVIVMLTTGWMPTIVTTGSMAPTLRPGDVLMIDEHPEELVGQRTVITFESGRGDGSFVTHRIFEVLPASDEYITKGDANQTPDTDRVTPEQVHGVGRLVIPLIGLPVVWSQQGNVPALAATVVLSAASAAVALSSLSNRKRRKAKTTTAQATGMADMAIRRVRFLVALMISSQFFLDGGRFETEAIGLSRVQLLVLAVGALGAINAASSWASQNYDGIPPKRVPTLELACDTALVIVLTTATGGSGIGWVLIALPIVEAAVRFRLAGALVHWMLMTGVTVATRLWVLEQRETQVNGVLDELEQLLDQLGVLLLVVIPGAYLAEQLLTDVVLQQRYTADAVERGRLLEHVAEVGHEVNRLGGELFDILATSVVSLGFDAADVCAKLPDTDWRVLAEALPDGRAALPPPGEAGSALREADLSLTEAIIDHADAELTEFLPVAHRGLGMLIRFIVADDDGAIVAVRAGLDFAAKPEKGAIEALRLLCGQATVALQNRQLLTELQEVHVELRHQATHDALTGLPNRAHFVEQLSTGLADAIDSSQRHAVLFLDLNGFKAVNDTLGHEAGDRLLEVVGERLVDAVGESGLVARLGGDEFTVLVEPTPDPDDAIHIASAIHRSLVDPIKLGREAVKVGASIGIAYAEVGLTESEILRRADAAMYAAKTGESSTRIRVYHSSLDEAERRRGRLAAEFKKALDLSELSLHFQPVIRTSTGRIVGAEALLRWTHRELGDVNTLTVLELAEVSGRVDELNGWIFKTALASVQSCNLRDDAEFFIALNVSPTELESDQLLVNLGDALFLSGVSSDRVIVELSERIVTDRGGSVPNVGGLADLGVRLSLDDFGEGQTSLAHLHDLPISQLKIDRRLVQQSSDTDADRIILESIVNLAHHLDLEVVAEGVETKRQHEIVAAAGADVLQGYLFYRPMPFAELRQLLDTEGLTETVVERASGVEKAPGKVRL